MRPQPKSLAVPRPTGLGPLQVRVVSSDSQSLTVELGVDYSKAQVPEHAYYADYCDVRKARIGVSLTFGKLEPGTNRLRTKIEIAFPEHLFALQLWQASRAFEETVRKLVGEKKLTPIKVEGDAGKVQTFRSNNAFMGTWGDDAVLDFYYISPRDMHEVLATRQKTTADLQPVVRVAMDTALMLEFLEKCEPIVDKTCLASGRVEAQTAEVRISEHKS